METLSRSAISPVERSRTVAELEASGDAFLEATHNLSAAQWSFQPAAGQWSIAECCEQVGIVEARALNRIAGEMQQVPADSSKRTQVRFADDAIVPTALNRTNRFQALDPLLPTQREAPEKVRQDVVEHRTRTLAYLASTPDNLRAHFLAHPMLGVLDTDQRVRLISVHMRRHTAQIAEIKSNPRFPME